MITTKNLSKIYMTGNSKFYALKSINLQIPDGQFLAITGRSGSGKSTLLYQLSLLDNPDEGHVEINKKNVSQLDTDEKTAFRLTQLGYVFQDYALIPTLTALENVMVPMLMQGYSTQQATQRSQEALTEVGLGEKINNLPSQMSGGQQQRVSIARAMGHEPSIIFADEPTANLDLETSEVVLQNFVDINKSGKTVIMVTHEPDYAKLAHRIITMSDGQIIEDILTRK